jgi:hypothetical protein
LAHPWISLQIVTLTVVFSTPTLSTFKAVNAGYGKAKVKIECLWVEKQELNVEMRRLSNEMDGLKGHLHQLVLQSSLVMDLLKIDPNKVAETAAPLHLGLTEAEKNSPSWASRQSV